MVERGRESFAGMLALVDEDMLKVAVAFDARDAEAQFCEPDGLTSASTLVDSILELAMFGQKSISNRLMLGVLFAGLNLLCFLGITHGRHVAHHTRVDYSHIPAHRTGRAGSRSGRFEVAVAVDSVIDHAVVDHAPQARLVQAAASGPIIASPIIAPQAVLVSAAFALPRPEGRIELLARENVMALGSAPRAPGLGRGPPAV